MKVEIFAEYIVNPAKYEKEKKKENGISLELVNIEMLCRNCIGSKRHIGFRVENIWHTVYSRFEKGLSTSRNTKGRPLM